MKNVKRVLGMLLATIMVLTLTMPVFATDVTISGKGNKFAAFKLMDRETNANDPSVFVYKVNPKYRDALKTFVTVPAGATDAEVDAAILQYLDDQNKAGADAVRKFADDLFALIDPTDIDNVNSWEIDTNGGNYTFTGLDEGYYMFVETEVADKIVDGEKVTEDEISQVILAPVFGDTLTIETKEDEVTSDKKLKDINDSEDTTPTDWQDGADHDIGDTIEYKLTGTVSSNYDAYDTYFFKFHDEMSKGLTFDGKDSVKVYLMRNGNKVGDITDGYVVDSPDDQHFTVTFADLKKAPTNPAVQAGDTIVVEFTATLNEDAEFGTVGNTNKSRVEYSNNPYDEDDHGFTPWDIVIVFTYKLIVNKVDGAGEAVEDAGFTLYKLNAATGDYEAVGAEIKGAQLTTFTWEGIDDGTYKLVETTVPAGYNKAADIEFKVVAVHDIIGDEPKLTDLYVTDMNGNRLTGTFTATLEPGTIATDVVNESGVELPKTGGIGTTIFYVLGTIMMIGAGVILVTRRRVR